MEVLSGAFVTQSVSPAVMRRLMRELNELQTSPPEGVRVSTSEENMLDVTGIIQGPGASSLCTLHSFTSL